MRNVSILGIRFFLYIYGDFPTEMGLKSVTEFILHVFK